jgi:hypothetical protein
MKIAKLAMCDRCLQYAEDCACCTSCAGEVYDHEHGCSEAQTKPRMTSTVVPREQPRRGITLRGIGQDLTIRTPVTVIRVCESARGLDSTDQIRVVRR